MLSETCIVSTMPFENFKTSICILRRNIFLYILYVATTKSYYFYQIISVRITWEKEREPPVTRYTEVSVESTQSATSRNRNQPIDNETELTSRRRWIEFSPEEG